MSDTLEFAASRDQQQAWKHQAIRAYAVAFLTAGLALIDNGVTYCGSDDVPDDAVPQSEEDHGIPGSAAMMLINAHLITRRYDLTIPDRGIFGGRRKSKRESANGRSVPVYSINRGLAELWLTRNGVSLGERQQDFWARVG